MDDTARVIDPSEARSPIDGPAPRMTSCYATQNRRDASSSLGHAVIWCLVVAARTAPIPIASAKVYPSAMGTPAYLIEWRG